VGVAMVSCANTHTLVLTADGRAWSCGESKHGALGNNTPPAEQTSVGHLKLIETAALVAGDASTLQAAPRYAMVALGGRHSVALDRNGWVWCCGLRESSGHPGKDDVLVPSRVRGSAGFAEVLFVAAGWDYALAVTGSGALWASGGTTPWPSRVAARCGTATTRTGSWAWDTRSRPARPRRCSRLRPFAQPRWSWPPAAAGSRWS